MCGWALHWKDPFFARFLFRLRTLSGYFKEFQYMPQSQLRPITFSGDMKSISDDDLCASCKQCDYRPGEMSGCREGWPGLEDRDGYVQECPEYRAAS